ncbi:hypothetical protein KNT64_gp195 [Pseudomonas phage PspYZU05]|uniref:Uncharacterized protein n=1 Tax=Pseudomonas phage PspYZU05 TaxID=1983556 RepID=A0A2U7NN49_9CAUD|nr:hypothetical protein KNT64_gp195 [Pseudomonas phage PspYZU05]ASD52147.1 hypothetical protein PspYZU05_195 [Pseudomonas phage PspYZU05]
MNRELSVEIVHNFKGFGGETTFYKNVSLNGVIDTNKMEASIGFQTTRHSSCWYNSSTLYSRDEIQNYIEKISTTMYFSGNSLDIMNAALSEMFDMLESIGSLYYGLNGLPKVIE